MERKGMKTLEEYWEIILSIPLNTGSMLPAWYTTEVLKAYAEHHFGLRTSDVEDLLLLLVREHARYNLPQTELANAFILLKMQNDMGFAMVLAALRRDDPDDIKGAEEIIEILELPSNIIMRLRDIMESL